MKQALVLTPFVLFVLLCSCEVFPEEEQVVCLPLNMSATVVQGTNTSKIIADFHYVPETELLDHITWSNHQTHYFEYNDAKALVVVRQMKVKEKVQEEMWFEYDGALISKVVLVKKNLDFTFLEPIDSAYTGHIDFEYEGKHLTRETRFEVSEEGGGEILVRTVEYAYDGEGNIVSSFTSFVEAGETETVEMTYDTGNHPFSNLRYYFNGESFVNNQLSKSSGYGDTDYLYNLEYNSYEYPETIYEKLGSSNTRIIRYTYQCM